jgi:hypothetical protein
MQQTEAGTVDDIDEGLRWATAGGVRVWDYIDRLLDERNSALRDA